MIQITKEMLEKNPDIVPDIFLGGTTGLNQDDWDWRRDLIQKIEMLNEKMYGNLTYFDPFLRPWETDEDWDEDFQALENKVKAVVPLMIFVLNSDINGLYSIEEITEFLCRRDSDNICPSNICVAVIDHKKSFTESTKRSLDACMRRWSDLHCTCTTSLDGIVSWLHRHPVPWVLDRYNG